MSRIYVVTDVTTNWKALVDADSQHQAINVVVGERYEAKAASSSDVAELMESGVKVQKAKKIVQADLPEIEPAPV